MKFHVITIFPEIIDAYANVSIMKRARQKKKIDVHTYDPRDFTKDKNKTAGSERGRRVDDKAYGGGPGMVMKAEPIIKAATKAKGRKKKIKILLLSPGGKQFTNTYADKLIKDYEDIVLISGRYEGIDARVKKILKAEEVSIGPYVLTGGELPALVVMDAVTRRIPGVLGKDSSVEERRTAGQEMYTRPESFEHHGKYYRVPKVLTSGDHGKINTFRSKKTGKS